MEVPANNSSATAQRIYYRSLTLALLSMRFTMEFASKSHGVVRSEDVYTYDRMKQILKTSAFLRETLTLSEERLLNAELGEWSPETVAMISWCSEEAGALLWAVNEIDVFPSIEESFTLEILNKYFTNLLSVDWIISCSKKKVILRERREIETQKKRTELLFQRCILANKIRYRTVQFPTKKYNDIFHFSDAGLPVGPSGDLIVGTEEFCDFSEMKEQVLVPIATSRIHSLAWALDPSQKWDSFDMDYLYILPTM